MSEPTTGFFVLVGGAASGPELWAPLIDELRGHDQDAIAVDIPCADESAGLEEYVDAVVQSSSGQSGSLVVVGHSFGAFAATAACAKIPAKLLVLVEGMVPAPGESPGAWWQNTGLTQTGDTEDVESTFQHDVPESRRRFATAATRTQAETPFGDEWPGHAWPNVPTRYLLCTEDRFLPPELLRQVVTDRLGIIPDEIATGHLPMLARPADLAERLLAYRRQLAHDE